MECTFYVYSSLYGREAAGKLIEKGIFVLPTANAVSYLILK